MNTWNEPYLDHDYIYSYQLVGETCDDGYYTSVTCIDCGYTHTVNYPSYGCDSNRTKHVLVHSGEGICGPMYLDVYSCACGEYVSMEFTKSCSMTHKGWNDLYGYDIYRCVNCGMEGYASHTSKENLENCTVTERYKIHYWMGEEVLVDTEYVEEEKEHYYIYSFSLDGDTCEDGYGVTAACMFCGQTKTYRDSSSYHNTFRIAAYDLREYGMCGGMAEIYSCPCDWNKSISYTNTLCNWGYAGTQADGSEMYYCSNCDTYRISGSSEELDHSACVRNTNIWRRYERDDQVLLELTVLDKEESHVDVVKYFELRGEDCGKGYIVNLQCAFCGRERSTSGSGHSTYILELHDLSEYGLCGGLAKKNACACGYNSNINYELSCENMTSTDWSESVDGRTRYYSESSCGDCGLRNVRYYYYVEDKDNCKEYCYTFYELYAGETLICSTMDTDYNTSHSYGQYVYTLNPGSVTCEDGLYAVKTCEVCGVQSGYYTSGHQTNQVESIDLRDYGAVCESYLTRNVCPCGARTYYYLDGDECCDCQEIGTDPWFDITNVIWDRSQYTAEGYHYFDSSFEKWVCAVTDPVNCGMTLRMADFWEKTGNCTIARYQIWQLGYDAATDTWQHEIRIATGETQTYHNYQHEFTEETLADGSEVGTHTYTCPDCGSWYSESSTYFDGHHTKSEIIYVNKLDDGRTKYRREIDEYKDVYNGYYKNVFERSEYIYADGSEYWNQTKRTYHAPEICGYTY